MGSKLDITESDQLFYFYPIESVHQVFAKVPNGLTFNTVAKCSDNRVIMSFLFYFSSFKGVQSSQIPVKFHTRGDIRQ